MNQCGACSWHRRRCVLVAGEVDARELAKFVEAVVGLDDPDGARFGSHHNRLGVRSAAAEADTAEQIPVGNPGGGKEYVLP